GQRQQHREAVRRSVAVGGRRRARIEVPAFAAVERARQRQATLDQAARGEVVVWVAFRQRGGVGGEAGVVERGQQAVDLAAVVLADVARQPGFGTGARGGGCADIAGRLLGGGRSQVPARLQRRRQRRGVTAGEGRGSLGGAAVLHRQLRDEPGQAELAGAADPARVHLRQQAAGTGLVAGLAPGEGGIGQQRGAAGAGRGLGLGFELAGGLAWLPAFQLGDGRGVLRRGRRGGRGGATCGQQHGQAGGRRAQAEGGGLQRRGLRRISPCCRGGGSERA